MRARSGILVITIVCTVTFGARASGNGVTAVAVGQGGQSIALSTATHTLIVRPKATALPTKATVTCVSIQREIGDFGPVALEGTAVYVAATAGSTSYYLFLFSYYVPKGETLVAPVIQLSLTTTAHSGFPCNVYWYDARNAAGLAVYR